jgi:hypothetical protein
VKFVATKNGLTKKNFSPLSFVAVFGSEIRDPGWVKIRIRDKHPGSATLKLFLQYLQPNWPSVAEPRAEEPKLDCFPEPEPKLRIAAPAPFFLPQTGLKEILVKKNGCWRSFCKL